MIFQTKIRNKFTFVLLLVICACSGIKRAKFSDPCKEYFGTTKRLTNEISPLKNEGNLILKVLHYADSSVLTPVEIYIVNRFNKDSIRSFEIGNKYFKLSNGIYDISFFKPKFHKYIINNVPITDTTTLFIKVKLGPDCSSEINKIYNGISY